MQATLTFTAGTQVYDFSASGTPQVETRRDYEAANEATAQLCKTTITVAQTFDEQSYADNEARIHLLRAALDAGEGILVHRDEHGTELFNLPVRVRTDNVPRAWRQYVAEVTVVFDAREALGSAGALPATFTPTGGSPVTLPNVLDWKVGVRVQRFSNQASNRDEAIETITASGFILADKTQPTAVRLAFLQAQLQLLRSCNAKDGALKWGTDTKTVRVASLDGDLGDGKDRLNWSLAAFYKSFPAGSYAQPEYTVKQRNDYEAGELVTSVSGKVKADTKADADTAVAGIRATYATGGRELTSSEVGDARVGGVDSADGATWLELTFALEFREPLPDFIGYKLRVDTKNTARDSDQIVTYSGTVTGTSAGAAVNAARTLGLGKLPFITSSTETVATRWNSVSGERFMEVAFSYEYLAKNSWLFAEVTREVQPAPFGDPRVTVSGFASASTLAAAETLADSFKIAGLLLRDSRKSYAERVMQNGGSSTRQTERVDFNFSYYSTPAAVTLAYGRETSTDFSALEKTINFSGTARGASESACDSAIDALMAGIAGSLTYKSRKADIEKQVGQSTAGTDGAGAQLISVAFSQRYVAPAEGEPGIDILSASYSVRTNYSINKASLSLIPYGLPYRQSGVGWTPAVQTISGTITARQQATAKTWGAARLGLLHGGGDVDVIEDDMQPVFLPMSGSVATKWTYNFTFAAKYVNLTY